MDCNDNSLDLYKLYIDDLKDIPLLSEEEKATLKKDGNLEDLITSNLKLVISIAYKYVGRGVDLLDLIQQGNLGLMRAAQKYDPQKGSFATYAYIWINSYILTVVRNASQIRYPDNVAYMIVRKDKIERIMKTESGREPEDDELAAALNISVDQLKKLRDAEERRNITSTDAPVRDKEGGSAKIEDLLYADDKTDPEKIAIRDDLKSELNKAIEHDLNEREQYVIRHWFGFGAAPETYTQIAKHFGLSRQRIHEIRNNALNKLSTKSSELKYFLR